MGAGSSTATGPPDYTLVLERVFDAPRALVFKAWTDAKHLVRWLGPAGFRGTIIKMDPRPGGDYRFHMRSAEGVEYWQQGVWREIIEPERFVRTCVWADAGGRPIGPEMLMTVTFEEHDGRTRLTFRQTFDSATARDQHRLGTASALDRLEQYLAAEQVQHRSI
jgi:uncharacterized protein YndB with AHSA1/START domain